MTTTNEFDSDVMDLAALVRRRCERLGTNGVLEAVAVAFKDWSEDCEVDNPPEAYRHYAEILSDACLRAESLETTEDAD